MTANIRSYAVVTGNPKKAKRGETALYKILVVDHPDAEEQHIALGPRIFSSIEGARNAISMLLADRKLKLLYELSLDHSRDELLEEIALIEDNERLVRTLYPDPPDLVPTWSREVKRLAEVFTKRGK
jgi:hypothetical protein